jgi:plasmid stabilization system protein ParE
MSYRVNVLARARQDFEAVIAWIAERSPEGAERLAARFEEVIARLERNPLIAPIAPESEHLGEELRQITFRTKAGRTFWATFTVAGDEVKIVQIRGAGHPPPRRTDLKR